MTLAALIFDVDGTLAETEEAHRAAFNTAFAAQGLPWHWTIEDYRHLLKTTGGKERMAAHQATLAGPPLLTAAQIANLHRDKTALYARILADGGLALRPGVADLIAAARRQGLAIAVATTTSAPNVEALCQCCWGRPASEIFDAIAAGDMVAAKKPAPDVYHASLAQLGLAADRAIAIEDSRNGLIAAKAAGLRVLVTPSVYTSDEDFTGADWLCATLEARHLPAALARLTG